MSGDVRRLLSIRARWTDEAAADFLRKVVIPAATGRRIGTDAAPAPREPKVLGSEWMTATQPDAAAMREASVIASFYEGVSPEVGRRRFDEYVAQREINRVGK